MGFKSLYNVLEDMYVHFIKKNNKWELEFIYFTELQKIFIYRTIKWLRQVIPKANFNLDSEVCFEGVVHSYLLFYVFLGILGRFSYQEEEEKELAIPKLRLLLS